MTLENNHDTGETTAERYIRLGADPDTVHEVEMLQAIGEEADLTAIERQITKANNTEEENS